MWSHKWTFYHVIFELFSIATKYSNNWFERRKKNTENNRLFSVHPYQTTYVMIYSRTQVVIQSYTLVCARSAQRMHIIFGWMFWQNIHTDAHICACEQRKHMQAHWTFGTLRFYFPSSFSSFAARSWKYSRESTSDICACASTDRLHAHENGEIHLILIQILSETVSI